MTELKTPWQEAEDDWLVKLRYVPPAHAADTFNASYGNPACNRILNQITQYFHIERAAEKQGKTDLLKWVLS